MSSWPPTPSFSPQGLEYYSIWCCLWSILELERSQGARQHWPAYWENDDHDPRGKRMPMLQLMITVGTEHRQNIQTASLHPVKNTERQLVLRSRVYYSAVVLLSLTYRFKRLLHIAPLSPLSYESNQLELNTDSTGITACHIRHPSVKITTSLPLCRGPCHAMITCHKAWDMCSGEEKKERPLLILQHVGLKSGYRYLC